MNCIKCNTALPADAKFCSQCGKKILAAKPVYKRNRGNGFGSVYKHNKGGYVAEYTAGFKPDGTRKSKKKYGFATKKEALRYLENLDKTKVTATLSSLYEQYAAEKLPSLTQKSQDRHKASWERLQALHKKNIDEITIDELNALVADKSYYVARYIKDLLSILYQMAIPRKFATTNLAKSMTLPTKQRGKKKAKFNTAEIAALWQFSEDPFAKIILVMIHTGMMPIEFMSLKPYMIDFERQIIAGNNSIKTELRSDLPIVFPDAITPLLKELIQNLKPDELLWQYKPITFYRRFNKFIKDHNFNPALKPYSARHTTASILASKENKPAIVAKIMRHSDFDTTLKYYTELDTEDLVAAVNTISPKKMIG